MPFPSRTFISELDPILSKELSSLCAQLQTYLSTEHDSDGHHTNITALSLSINGVTISPFAQIPTACTLDYYGTVLPDGFLWADNSEQSQVLYPNLYVALGSVTSSAGMFRVTDRRGKFALGKAASGTGSTLGSTGGALDHDHPVSGTTGTGGGFAAGVTGDGGGFAAGVTGDAGGFAAANTDSGNLQTTNHSFASGLDFTGDTVDTPDHEHETASQADHHHTSPGQAAHNHTSPGQAAHDHAYSTTSGTANPAFIVCNVIIKT